MISRSVVVAIAAIAISASCSPAGPSVVADTTVPDTSVVTANVVEQFRSLGLDVEIAQRLGGTSNVAMEQMKVMPVGDNLYLHVYRTAELAADEASRITPDGQVRSAEGAPRMIVDYIERQSFHYADRVLARHSGCDTRVSAVMEKLFGPPIVVTIHRCR